MISELQKELKDWLKLDVNFETVEELHTITNKVNNIISNEKYKDFNEIAENNKFKSILIENDPINLEIEIPIKAIKNKENYKTFISSKDSKFWVLVTPNDQCEDTHDIFLQDLNSENKESEYICKL